MAEFKRGANELIERLRTENLFQCKLLPDIEAGKVFFAIRDKYISFYYKGGSLFKYDGNGFSTHYKYGFVPSDNEVASYITENNLRDMKIAKCFSDGYVHIKERVEKYASVEAEGVSALYTFAPRAANKDNRYFLVDIEVAFSAQNDMENQNDVGKINTTDRIDILVYDNKARQLLFCEAKHFSNKEIWAKENNTPQVVAQLERYNGKINANKQAIKDAYKNAFDNFCRLTGVKLQPPESVHEQCMLLIFGYDSWQEGKIKKLLIKDGSLLGYNYKTIGSISDNVGDNKTIENLFKSTVQKKR